MIASRGVRCRTEVVPYERSKRETSCSSRTRIGAFWIGVGQLERAVVSRSADFCADGNCDRVYCRAAPWGESREAGYSGREKFLDAGTVHDADGDDYYRRVCGGFDADCVSRDSSAGWNSEDAARRGGAGGAFFDADVADLVGPEPDFQRAVCSGAGASREGDGLPRGGRGGVSGAGGGVGDGAVVFGGDADGDEKRDAGVVVQHQRADSADADAFFVAEHCDDGDFDRGVGGDRVFVDAFAGKCAVRGIARPSVRADSGEPGSEEQAGGVAGVPPAADSVGCGASLLVSGGCVPHFAAGRVGGTGFEYIQLDVYYRWAFAALAAEAVHARGGGLRAGDGRGADPVSILRGDFRDDCVNGRGGR